MGNVDAVESLLRNNGISLSSSKDSNDFGAAHYAAGMEHQSFDFLILCVTIIFVVGGKLNVLQALAKKDSNALAQKANTTGIAPLHLALYYGHADAAKFILDRVGGSFDSHRRSPLFYASLGMPF